MLSCWQNVFNIHTARNAVPNIKLGTARQVPDIKKLGHIMPELFLGYILASLEGLKKHLKH